MGDSSTFSHAPVKNPVATDLRGGVLFTPPEHMADSFPKDTTESHAPEWKNKLPPIQKAAPSPPITPETNSYPSFSITAGYGSQDAPLFPNRASSEASHIETPLFESDNRSQLALSPPIERAPAPKSVSDLLSSRTNLGRVIGPGVYIEPSTAGVRDWYNARMAELKKCGTKLPTPRVSDAAKRDAYTTRQIQSLGKPTGIVKLRSVPRPISRPTPAKPRHSDASPSSPPGKVAIPPSKRPPPRRRSNVPVMPEYVDDVFPSAAHPTKHKRAAPSKKVEGKEEDQKWRDLPDHCPPLESLESAPKPLKADWKAEPKDISHEPDADQLGPAEYALASSLRLLPQQYLANKRRMFNGRLQHLRDHKNFTKTAAQLACNIDVNKASALWEAFNRVGWFREVWFEKWL